MASEKKIEKYTSFNYIATNPTAGVVRGEVRAVGQDNALLQLERMGLEPISVTEKKEGMPVYTIKNLKKPSDTRVVHRNLLMRCE